MSALRPVLAVLGAAPERLWGAMMKRMVANGDVQVRGAVFDSNKIFFFLKFFQKKIIVHMGGRVPPDLFIYFFFMCIPGYFLASLFFFVIDC